MSTLTPQQKTELGLTLSGADIQALLNNPNSWVSRLYNDCLLITAISVAQFIQILQCVMQQQTLLAQQLEIKELVRAERDSKAESRYYEELYTLALSGKLTAQQPSQSQLEPNLLALKLEMTTLIALPQTSMSAAQLATQHQQITKNLNNQVAVHLGTSITVPIYVKGASNTTPITLTIPSLNSKPAASAVDLVKLNPALGTQLAADEGVRAGFARHAAKAGVGYLAVLNKWNEIAKHNSDAFKAAGIDEDNMNLSPSMLKNIDKAYQHCLNDNKGLVECLQKNNELALDAFLQPTIQQQNTPAATLFTTPKPTPGMSAKSTNIDEEHLSSTFHYKR